ncbi:MAG: TIGR04211 family SH3 domain-containing protein [Gammaproteobacteria bacterium]|nr:TIGR04211 family SH3 domain-containing protein [Gammaproteobacteria bacterium]
MKYLILSLLAGVTAINVWAEKTAYVTDNLSTAVRSGATNEYRILFYLPAGTQLTVLDDPAENGFVKVRDGQGREGWTLERFVTEQKGARIRLAETQEQLSKALLEIESLKQQHQKQLSSIQEKMNQSQQLIEEAQNFQQTISELQTKNSTLMQQNRRMNDRYLKEWFFAGSGVILVGIIFGLLLGRMSRKKKSGWA